MTETNTSVDRLSTVMARMAKAGGQVGRNAPSATLIAISKSFSAEEITPLLEAGHHDFGENRVQEAREKWNALKKQFPRTVLHLVGPLQSNKVRDALAIFDAIHSLDRDSLAEALAREMARSGAKPILFVQVNTGMEPQKSGVVPRDVPQFVHRLQTTHGLSHQGLMCIPPEADDPGPHFGMLRQIAKDCGLTLLSMGMSGDFETAIQLGATHVRVGSAIFGERHAVSSI